MAASFKVNFIGVGFGPLSFKRGKVYVYKLSTKDFEKNSKYH
jgi:hypothetical protein